NMEDWTEKYRPKRLDEILGNQGAVSALRKYADTWESGKIPKKRAVILSGKPGVGKTSSALALANEYKWSVIELNASDARNANMIKKIATAGALHDTLDYSGFYQSSGGRRYKLIILDEADNLYEQVGEHRLESVDLSDRGGKKAIIETIQVTRQPIILIVNDYYSLIKGSGEALSNLCTVINFYEVSEGEIVNLLKRICQEENINADLRVLESIAARSKGDVRSAINDLQSLAINNRRIDIQNLDILGHRDRERYIFDALRDIFKRWSIPSNRGDIIPDIEPEIFLLWINENVPRVYQGEDLVKSYDNISKADIFFSRVYRRQYYNLWSYACELMTHGVSLSKTRNYGFVQYSSPVWTKELKLGKTTRERRKNISSKISRLCHASCRKTQDFILPMVSTLFQRDTKFACNIKKYLELSEEDIIYLLGDKYTYKLDEINKYCEEKNDEQLKIDDVDNEKKGYDVKNQPSLFDF
ncbi:MAG: replication factor C large subunit, partial [Candidatus Thermoplasmatota archaeon]